MCFVLLSSSHHQTRMRIRNAWLSVSDTYVTAAVLTINCRKRRGSIAAGEEELSCILNNKRNREGGFQQDQIKGPEHERPRAKDNNKHVSRNAGEEGCILRQYKGGTPGVCCCCIRSPDQRGWMDYMSTLVTLYECKQGNKVVLKINSERTGTGKYSSEGGLFDSFCRDKLHWEKYRFS